MLAAGKDDPAVVKEWRDKLRSAAVLGSAWAMGEWGAIRYEGRYDTGKSIDDAIGWWERGMKKKDGRSTYEIAARHMTGTEGQPKNPKLGESYMHDACERNHGDACIELGDLRLGREEKKRAKTAYTHALQLGNPHAQMRLDAMK